MSRFRTIATAAALAGTAALAVVAASAAQASGTKAAAPWCTGDDLAIRVDDMHSPSAKDKAHVIRFVAAEGASCRIGGTVSNLRFLDWKGEDVHAALNGRQPPYTETLVGGDSYAAMYIASNNEGPQQSPAFVRFNLPGQGQLGALVTVAWPASGIGAEYVRGGGIQAPVG
ncbi:hypothetical protein [Lentzea sp. NPDC059081]|uniref:hypothetical protein n=1 Tax=Lentzea sp. NPDC059081 TaxID=3346719 RepID=UPI0036C28AEA